MRYWCLLLLCVSCRSVVDDPNKPQEDCREKWEERGSSVVCMHPYHQIFLIYRNGQPDGAICKCIPPTDAGDAGIESKLYVNITDKDLENK